MGILSGVSDFFGLDIGSTAIRVVQLKGSSRIKTLVRYGFIPVDEKLVSSNSASDVQHLGNIIADLINKTGISTTNVAVGIQSNKVFSTVVDFDNLPEEELVSAIQYQADSIIPTPLAQSKIDWAPLGVSPTDQSKIEVLLSSVSNDYVEQRLDMLEAIGLNVIAFEPDTMAIARSIIPADNSAPQLILDMGKYATDLVITINGVPRLTRAITTGTDAPIRAAAQNLNIDVKQAEQFVFKFGLSKDKLEGQVHNALAGTIDSLISEVERSIKFFQDRYQGVAIDRIVVTGGASALPEFPLQIANKFSIQVEIGNAWRNVSFPASMQNELLAVSNHFGVAVGLAERMS